VQGDHRQLIFGLGVSAVSLFLRWVFPAVPRYIAVGGLLLGAAAIAISYAPAHPRWVDVAAVLGLLVGILISQVVARRADRISANVAYWPHNSRNHLNLEVTSKTGRMLRGLHGRLLAVTHDDDRKTFNLPLLIAPDGVKTRCDVAASMPCQLGVAAVDDKLPTLWFGTERSSDFPDHRGSGRRVFEVAVAAEEVRARKYLIEVFWDGVSMDSLRGRVIGPKTARFF
jgi:hypothetical protein